MLKDFTITVRILTQNKSSLIHTNSIRKTHKDILQFNVISREKHH